MSGERLPRQGRKVLVPYELHILQGTLTVKGFPTIFVYAFFMLPVRSKCPASVIPQRYYLTIPM
jgi:hypothetical protein